MDRLIVILSCIESYLLRSGDTTEMVQSITAPMELVQSPNLHEILFSGSESKWYFDPLEP